MPVAVQRPTDAGALAMASSMGLKPNGNTAEKSGTEIGVEVCLGKGPLKLVVVIESHIN